MFGDFHICAKFFRIEKKRAKLTGVETVRDGHQEFFIEFKCRGKLEEQSEEFVSVPERDETRIYLLQ